MSKSAERESERLKSQSRLDSEKELVDRNKLGQFATPPELADSIVEYAASQLPKSASIRFLDPGFGTGSFFSSLLRTIPKRIEHAAGFEIDPHYGDEAQLIWRGTQLNLEIADFTTAEVPRSKFNLIVSNPPYVRHHHLSQAQKSHLKATTIAATGVQMSGLAGLYGYFMLISRAWMTNGGIGAWLIPSEFMDVNYGDAIKRFLIENVTLLSVHRFDPAEVQFDDALVSSAVVVFRNDLPSPSHTVRFSFGGTLNKPRLSSPVPVSLLKTVRKWTSLPQSVDADRTGAAHTIGDLFTIKRGLATGCNEFFIVNPEVIEHYSLPRELFVPILPSPRFLASDEIEADPNGNPLIERKLFLMDCRLPESEIKSRYPSLWRYLQSGIEHGVNDRYLCKERGPLWYSQDRRLPCPFLCTYMGRTVRRDTAFRFILNNSNAIAANVYLMLYPKPILAGLLESDSSLKRKIWQALSRLAPESLLGEGRVYGGGLHKIEPKELANVSIDAIAKHLPKRSFPKQLFD